MSHKGTHPETVLYCFTDHDSNDGWTVEDDNVMGGKSEGHFETDEEGHGRFWGHVSLENDGGFSSIRYEFDEAQDVSDNSSFQMRIKGDGKDYTLRVKADPDQNYYHQGTFSTKGGEWETVAIPFSVMYAMHHGEKVDVPNYKGEKVVEFQLLIGNKKEQDFEILLEAIEAL